MQDLGHRIASVFSLMSRLPIRMKGEADYADADWMIPLVGLPAAAFSCAGAALGVLAFGPGLLAAACALGAQYAAFNLFHFDGLVDSADALGAFGDAEKRRTALKDPRIGSFGLFAGVLAIALRLAATAGLLRAGSALPWAALIMAPAAGRLAAMVVLCSGTAASDGGLGSALAGARPERAALGFIIAAAPGSLLFGLHAGPLAAGLCILVGALLAIAAGLAVGQWYRKTFGGYSGDALGAAVELGELALLCAAAAIFGAGY
jgi:adenosylcobinamide-GDP ribazoletransferase